LHSYQPKLSKEVTTYRLFSVINFSPVFNRSRTEKKSVTLTTTGMVMGSPFYISPEQAQVSGFSSRFYHNLMLALIAVAVIISFQTVGTMLVFGMLLAPAGAAALLARRMHAMMIYASIIGIVSVYSGLLVSYQFNIAAGSAIVLVATLIFFIVLLVKNLQSASLQKGALHND